MLWTQGAGARAVAVERAPPCDIRTWVVWLAMTSGFRPSKRRPLSGDAVLWRACAGLGNSVRYEQERPGPMPGRPVFAEPPNGARPQAVKFR